jgi:ABC-type ATPase with predicted acetyltransferase domain
MVTVVPRTTNAKVRCKVRRQGVPSGIVWWILVGKTYEVSPTEGHLTDRHFPRKDYRLQSVYADHRSTVAPRASQSRTIGRTP